MVAASSPSHTSVSNIKSLSTVVKIKEKRKNFPSFFFHLSDSLVNLFISVRFDTVYYYIIN